MRILVAVDQSPYSAHAVNEVARLARNTWANITLLGVLPKRNGREGADDQTSLQRPLAKALHDYRETILRQFGPDGSPYLDGDFGYELVELRRGVWEELLVRRGGKKSLRARMRSGNPVKAVLAEAAEADSDLIVLGCDRQGTNAWEGWPKAPQKIVNDAACSVLVAKEEKKVEKIVCCLDHDLVSQPSLEMINQMVSLHGAGLEIVGIADAGGLKAEVEKKMSAILKYYTDRQLNPWIKMVELASLQSFVSQEARQGLVALWMGKKSPLQKVFSRNWINTLVDTSASSILLLR